MMLKNRRFLLGLNTAALVLIGLAIVVLVNLISQRTYKRFDLTANRAYTLSDQTRKVLKGLKKDLTVTAFFKDAASEKKGARDLLEQFRASSRRVRYRFVDPDRDPGSARRLGVTSYGTMVMEYDGRQEKIFAADEKAVATALLKLTGGRARIVCVTKGHGEKASDDSEGGGMADAKKGLEDEQYAVREIVLLQEGIPADCTVLLVPGPKSDFLQQETAEMERFVNAGGRVLVLMEQGRYPNLRAFLAKYGVTAGDDVVVDLTSRRFLGDAMSPMVMDYPGHDITRNLRSATILMWACSVEPAAAPPPGATVQSLARTSANAWAETNVKSVESGYVKFDPKQDRQGPISVAAVSEVAVYDTMPAADGGAKKGRVIAFGDSDFATDKFIALSGNRDLLLNAVAWLAEEDVLVSIRSKDKSNQPLNLTARQGILLFAVPVAVIPLAIAFAGAFVCLRRKLIR